ncbi:MAG: hypothetical protein IPN16_24550 [Gemmatimonadetes bacterium]|nr:hypothetical protein [Gemmatimonadota bacterium]
MFEHVSREQPRPPSRRTAAAFTVLMLSLAGCASDRVVAVDGTANRRVVVAVGSEIGVTLGTVGPGEYTSPPNVSSAVVRFLDVTPVGPSVPAGVRQRFRLKAVTAGRAIIVFHHSAEGPVVTDTIDVR